VFGTSGSIALVYACVVAAIELTEQTKVDTPAIKCAEHLIAGVSTFVLFGNIRLGSAVKEKKPNKYICDTYYDR